MVDIHCHILAEVDDGPKSWDVSEQMCRMAKADGVDHIVATPHANHRYAYDHLRDYKQAAENYHKFLEAARGAYPDQEWQARHRLIAIEPKK
jgi:protein-tyrosine phosphatase